MPQLRASWQLLPLHRLKKAIYEVTEQQWQQHPVKLVAQLGEKRVWRSAVATQMATLKVSGPATISRKDCFSHHYACPAQAAMLLLLPHLHYEGGDIFSQGARGWGAEQREAAETREALSRGFSAVACLVAEPIPQNQRALTALAGMRYS